MPSDFAFAREHLEHAWLHLSGDDETSRKVRQALDLLIEAVAAAQFTAPRGGAEILQFSRPSRHSSR
nr:hypothetical protein [Mesorhizobium sp. J18]